MIFFDTETCGLHGPIVLIQWAEDDGPVNLHSVWTEPIGSTLDLIDSFVNHESGVCGFNLAFDWFHICQTFTTLFILKLALNCDEETCPIDYIDHYALAERKARDLDICLKPETALDLMLHARKGPYQSTMNRGDIKIRKVPSALALDLAKILDKRIQLKDIYFARRKDPSVRWQVMDIEDDLGNIVQDFKNIVLKFQPSSALKALAQDALNLKKVIHFGDVEPPRASMPEELGYAPFALAIGSPEDWKGAWPEVINVHIRHWAWNPLAQEYAMDDVVHLQDLYKYFGKPKSGDDDSVLACMVGAIRWRGFEINIERVRKLRDQAIAKSQTNINFNSIEICRRYLSQVLDATEIVVMHVGGKMTTKGIILEEIAKWKETKVCESCQGKGCTECDAGLVDSGSPHPAAVRAREILDFRHACKEVELYNKLLTAGKFHASFTVIGALSSRMSGADGLNAQGIRRANDTRSCFNLAPDNMVLSGGDFSGFEICLMDAAFNDPILRAILKQRRPCKYCEGKGCDECYKGTVDTKIHAVFGQYLFPPMTYDEILATKGLPDEGDKYTRSKNGVFALAYGGESYTLQNRVGVSEEAANEAYQKWCTDFKVWAQERKKVFDMFCSMRQPNGIGSKVEWHEPAEYVESLFGFKRYFTIENQICRTLYQLGENPPKEWEHIKIKVMRRERLQTAVGAVRSALFGAAFQLQAANMRAAGNHIIQSTGAEITKALQCRSWKIQPSGICSWRLMPFNAHDEIMCPIKEEHIQELDSIRNDFLDEMKETVPLIAIEWSNNLETWADK